MVAFVWLAIDFLLGATEEPALVFDAIESLTSVGRDREDAFESARGDRATRGRSDPLDRAILALRGDLQAPSRNVTH